YNDILWIGTSEGLVKFNKNREVFTRYTDEDGLSNNTIYGVLIDDEGNPWVSTNNGISKFDLKTCRFNNLSSTDGLQSNEFNEKAYYKTRDGEFIFGGIKGLNIFKPENILKSSYEPRVIFESFDVSGEKYKNIDKMEFKHNENFFRIKYFFPEYKSNNNLKFYYKLEGLMEDWIQVNGNEIIFNKLSPGRYTFKIKARSQNGNMGKESKVSFTIKPPLWRRKEAILVYIFIILLTIYIHSKKVKRLDYLVEIRTRALNEEMKTSNQLLNKIIEVERNKNNYFINLSHELRTPLNVISSIEQLITNINQSDMGVPKEKLEEYMQVMNKNIKRLLNLINNIIDTTKIENGKYKINVREENIVYLVEETALSLKNAIESKGINLIIDTDTEEKIVKCDSYEIERCIVNLLGNASKFTPKGGTIKVDIKDFNDKVKIIVEDTGIGIDEKYYKAIFDRFNQIVDENTEVKGGSGLGLTITKHIIDMHNGDIYVESKKNIGTKFTIILPVEGDIDKDILI
ncbi:MAG: ATP-binding protein, partial [Intestinibacter sp.]|uniref:ATP-binding protein n=1 Tax=Intestinibacter sp. TaxID=1965304 RepID=UPI003F1702A0